MLKSPGEFQSLGYKLKSAKADLTVYLKKVGFDGILYKIFINNSDVNFEASLKSEIVPTENLTKEEILELMGILEKLQHICWKITEEELFI